MKEIKTVVLVKGDERVIVNAGDQETAYMSEGWLHECDEGIVEGTKHVGGGWYELPDGTRVKGKAAAEEALTADTGENGTVGKSENSDSKQ